MSDEVDTVTNRTADWSTVLKTRFKKELIELGREYPHKKSLYLDYREILAAGKTGITLADELLENPGKVIEDIRDAVRSHHLIKTPTSDSKPPEDLNIRFRHLPRKIKIRDLRAEDINTFVSFECLVARISEVRPRCVEALFRCPGGHFTVRKQKYGKFTEPEKCATEGCLYKRLEFVPKRSKFVNNQKMRIQESPEGMRAGEQPQSIPVDANDDLCGVLFPGDRVIMHGILRQHQRVIRGEKSTIFDLYLELNSYEIAEREYEEIEIDEAAEQEIKMIAAKPDALNLLTQSIAPTIFGMDEVKKGVLLILFGGETTMMPDGTTLRGNSHVLVIGDPGIAKSQLLRYIVRVTPRGIFTTGDGSSGVGLTATVSKDEFGDGRWMVEAGALPSADKGVLCLDEINRLPKEYRGALNEAMEQQTVTVAKASICRTLDARCSVIAAANPKLDRFDIYQNLHEQINLPPTLLSRFDLIFLITDVPEEKRDTATAMHILNARMVGEYAKNKQIGDLPEETRNAVLPTVRPILLRQWIAYAKRNIFPKMTPQVQQYLADYYVRTRGQAAPGKPVPITARALEATVRLSEAAARLRLSPWIEMKDVNIAVEIFHSCLKMVAIDPATGQFDVDRVAATVTQHQRDLRGKIKQVAREWQIKTDGKYIPRQELIEEMTKLGFRVDEIERMIDGLLRSGEMIEPQNEVYRVIG